MKRSRSIAAYLVLLGIAIGIFLAVRDAGSALIAPPPASGRFGDPRGAAHLDVLVHILIALIAIIGAARLLGRIGHRFGQPAVVGEVIAGLLLGPSFLGRIWPAAAAFVLPAHIAPLIQALAQVGVILFMFLVGVELDPAEVRKRGQAAIAISHASIIVPFSMGSVLALFLYPRLGTSDVPFTSFALFIGISMSITAFPVLARILGERGLDKTPYGALALTCAAVDDVSAWCLLALIVGAVQSRTSGAYMTGALAIVFVLAVVFVVRPLVAYLSRDIEKRGELTQTSFAAVIVIALACALATDAIGIHALFGAFAVGACVPNRSALAKALRHRIEDLVVVLFLPAFFALTGMRTQVGLLDGAAAFGCLAAVLGVACVGKVGGGMLAARMTGLAWRDAAAIGLLMNTRGLVELVVLNIGLELHVISPAMFTILVIMAVSTTLMTAPLLGAWDGGGRLEQSVGSPGTELEFAL